MWLTTKLFVLVGTLCTVCGLNSFDGLEEVPASRVVATEGETVILPCDVKPAIPSDRAILMLIFKQGIDNPIFTIDGRHTTNIEDGIVYVESEQLQKRVKLMSSTQQHGLLLSQISSKDAGVYRCRVDFKKTPTRDTKIHLTVVSPPKHQLITSGGRIVSGVIGPYNLGETLVLSCQVAGGDPKPDVIWFSGGQVVDGVEETSSSEITLNKLILPALSLDDVEREIICRANNSELSQPLVDSVKLSIITPPLEVSLWLHSSLQDSNTIYSQHETASVTLKADQLYGFKCAVKGANPSVMFTWSITTANNVLVTEPVEYLVDRSYATPSSLELESVFQYVPSFEHNGAMLVCSARNPELEHVTIVRKVHLNILHLPQVVIRSQVHEKKDMRKYKNYIALKCHVSANPRITNLKWIKDGEVLKEENTVENFHQSYTLRMRYRDVSNGNYSCEALNDLGVAASAIENVRIKKRPECIIEKYGRNVHQLQLKEELALTCPIKSYPDVSTIKWSFKNPSGQIVHLLQSEVPALQKVFRYIPRTIDDFGTLLCSGKNDVGEMVTPCEISVIPIGTPEPVSKCSVITTPGVGRLSFLSVSCEAGWDGGSEQKFTLHVYSLQSEMNSLVKSVYNHSIPFFGLPNLESGRYLFTIEAVNGKGSSPPIKIKYTIAASGIATGTMNSDEIGERFFSWIFVAAAAIGVIFILVCSVLIVKCVCSCKKKVEKQSVKKDFLEPFLAFTDDKDNVTKLPNVFIAERKAKTENAYSRSPNGSKEMKVFSQSSENDQAEANDSGCDVRVSSPCLWDPNSNDSVYENTYKKYSGPYHIDNLSPPPSIHENSTAPLTSSPNSTSIPSSSPHISDTLSTFSGVSTSTRSNSPDDNPNKNSSGSVKSSTSATYKESSI